VFDVTQVSHFLIIYVLFPIQTILVDISIFSQLFLDSFHSREWYLMAYDDGCQVHRLYYPNDGSYNEVLNLSLDN